MEFSETTRRKSNAEKQHGLRHLAYTSIQGGDLLFPSYFLYDNDRYIAKGRLTSAYEEISVRARPAKPIGVFGAAWDDCGLHNETFWLGWATVAQNGWAPGLVSAEQTTAEFMELFYGPRTSQMVDVYRALQSQARFFESSWDRVVSRVRGPGYGNSYGKGVGTTRYDQTLPRPALPALPGLDFTPIYSSGKYGKLVDSARSAASKTICSLIESRKTSVAPSATAITSKCFFPWQSSPDIKAVSSSACAALKTGFRRLVMRRRRLLINKPWASWLRLTGKPERSLPEGRMSLQT